MRIRPAIACSLVLALALPVSAATAAPKKKKAAKPAPPVCHLLTDESGDGYPSVPGPAAKSDALDITGGDVATGKNTVVGVLRVKTTDTANDPLALAGMEWTLSFKIKETQYKFKRMRLAGANETYSYQFLGGTVLQKDLKVTESATEIRWTVPRKGVPDLKKAKMVAHTLTGTSRWFTFNADDATTLKTYADLTPSCLKPV